MLKRNISKLLIFLMTASLGVVKAYGYAEAEQQVLTTVQPAVTISASSSSITNGTVNPLDGTLSGLKTVFDVLTNGNDDSYDFVVTSQIDVDGSSVSAFGNDGKSLLFAHAFDLPTADAVNDAKQGGNNNANVIAYPLIPSSDQPLTMGFEAGNALYGDCYKVRVNGSTETKSVYYEVGKKPVNGTYNIGQDQCGTYKVTLTFTTHGK